jgi:hypothetical protein
MLTSAHRQILSRAQMTRNNRRSHHIMNMTRKSEQADQNIDAKAIARSKNEGGASGSLKQGADDFRLYEAVDSNWRHRRLRLAGRVVDLPVSVCSDGREKELHCARLRRLHETPRPWP